MMIRKQYPTFVGRFEAVDALRGLANHPHITMLDRFFRDISESRLRRGVFTSEIELVTVIDEYASHHNTDSKPLI